MTVTECPTTITAPPDDPVRVTLEDPTLQHRIRSYARAALRGHLADAEDVVQLVAARAWERRTTFDPSAGSVTSWLFGITNNVIRELSRRRSPAATDPAVLADDLTARLDREPDLDDLRFRVEKYLSRLAKVIDKADELGMVVILGLYYFGQDERVKDEKAVIAGVDATVDWLVARKYTNVLVEVNNECNVKAYDHDILKPDRVHELIERVKKRSAEKQHPLLSGTSYGGGAIPKPNVVRASDFLLLHGNGVKEPKRITEMVQQTRKVDGYRPMPILFNEDDHFDFDKPENNFAAAVREYASWGTSTSA